MINKIKLKNIATYPAEQEVVIDDIKKVNFFYGTNGSGKTTISNVLRDASQYSNCKVEWLNDELKVQVYNQKFIEENFHQDKTIKGIFTLGKESEDIKADIRSKKDEENKIQDKLISMSATFDSKESEYRINEENFVDECWSIKVKYDEVFSKAFAGFRNNKIKFMEQCKQIQVSDGDIYEYADLLKKVNILFKSDLVTYQELSLIEASNLNGIMKDSIFNKSIVGRSDLEISRLIDKLSIHDWIKQGMGHIHDTEGVCPFCQRVLPDNIKSQLAELFDFMYEEDMRNLHKQSTTYETIMNQVIVKINRIDSDESNFIEKEKVKLQLKSLLLKHESNMNKIQTKLREPSIMIELESIDDEINNINSIIKQSNSAISKHNTLIVNKVHEEKTLVNQIWKFISLENKQNFKRYVEKEHALSKAISGIRSSIDQQRSFLRKIRNEITELQNQITSVLPTVNEMNRILETYNFTSFKLATTPDQQNYMLVRNNGEEANKTLSEGEKTFVTFLYFLSLTSGSDNKEEVSDDRVVVIDDPISSLDSNVLFIVSSLLLRMIEDVRSGNSNINQLFILTHNIYFHKEVTFNKKRSGDSLRDEAFWIVRKVDNISEVQRYSYNPIKTSYELLWEELKIAKDRSSSSVQNIIRRIIENYFKIFGNYSEDDIINKFAEDEKVICKSLMSWINDGSHSISDDLYVEHPEDVIERYLLIFEKIFRVTHHHAHYKMMMGINDDIASDVTQEAGVLI